MDDCNSGNLTRPPVCKANAPNHCALSPAARGKFCLLSFPKEVGVSLIHVLSGNRVISRDRRKPTGEHPLVHPPEPGEMVLSLARVALVLIRVPHVPGMFLATTGPAGVLCCL